jgi:hypothetical protein
VLRIIPSGTFTNGQTFTLFKGAGATNASNYASLVGSPGVGKAFSFTNGALTVVSTAPTPPVLSGYGPLSGGSFPLTFTGPTGQSYSVLSSTNVALPLASWSVLTTGTFGAGGPTSTNYTDTGATNTQQF